MSKAAKRLIGEAQAAGGRAVVKRSGVMIHGPKGSAMIHATTSDNRALANARADLKRAGLSL